MICVLYRQKKVMIIETEFYVYNNGDLKRKDNTLQFTAYDGEKEIFQLKEFQIYM